MDFETTGLDLSQDQILSYGAVTIRGGRVRGESALYGLARPSCSPSPASVAVHALRTTDCAGAPGDRDTAVTLGTALDGKILIAHAAWIETSFLKRYLALDHSRPTTLVVDTAALARSVGLTPERAGAEPGLEWLSHELGLPAYTPHHALGDAMTTAVVFLALAGRLTSEHPGLTAGDLIKRSHEHSLG